MKHQINIEGIRLYAYHGCLPEETKVGAEYIVDVYMVCDFKEAAIKDDLNLTIDYCSIFEIYYFFNYELINNLVSIFIYQTLKHLAIKQKQNNPNPLKHQLKIKY